MPKNHNIIAIIPARYESQRLPGKLMLKIGDKSILQHAYDNAVATKLFSRVVIAGDKKIMDKIDWDCERVLTRDNHNNGTSRIGEAAQEMDADYLVNIQGDEPFINNDLLLPVCEKLRSGSDIATLITNFGADENIFDYNAVKVVVNELDKALYFSRQAIPAIRDLPYREWQMNHTYYKHIGIYGFKKSILLSLLALEHKKVSQLESLEQLNWLIHGFQIDCAFTSIKGIGVDTEEDLLKARKFYKKLLSKE